MRTLLYEGRDDVYIDAYYPETAARPLPAVVICPGGGYFLVGSTEGRPVSDKFTEAGYAAFILHYTVGTEAAFGPGGFKDFAPAQDLDAAMRLLHAKAYAFGVDPGRISVIGFSAGGHLCAAWAFSGAFKEAGLRTKAIILSYPMRGGTDGDVIGSDGVDFDITRMQYTDDPAAKNTPTFLWHARDDQIVPFDTSEKLSARFSAEGIPHTFFVCEHGIHARPFYAPEWFFKAMEWLAAFG